MKPSAKWGRLIERSCLLNFGVGPRVRPKAIAWVAPRELSFAGSTLKVRLALCSHGRGWFLVLVIWVLLDTFNFHYAKTRLKERCHRLGTHHTSGVLMSSDRGRNCGSTQESSRTFCPQEYAKHSNTWFYRYTVRVPRINNFHFYH